MNNNCGNLVSPKLDGSTLEGQIELLHNAISELESAGQKLENRIGNILLPEVPQPCSEATKPAQDQPLVSNLTSRVKEAVRRLNNSTDAVKNLTYRANS